MEKLRGKTVLIVEDEERIRRLIKMALTKIGFEVLEAADGFEAKEQYLKYDPCFIILDIMLPGINGKEICSWLRQDLKSNVPIIMLSAIHTEKDKVEGLKLGADDYMAKPFSLDELTARVETVLRRTANRCSKISYRGLTLKPIVGMAKFEDAVLDLTLFEYKLLYQFMTHPDQVFSREQLITLVYKNEEKLINERTVDVHIKNLREKIAQYSEYPFIQTVRGIGYKFTT
ncbi:response regulator transcription factor [Bacillus sp. FJAT-49705]|uniref:Response regulator transcription factor n=2 Tax=Cytobacillus TaxID=2675230 RepID=A0A5B8ZBA9_CYTDA|nr:MULTISPECIES: response regulator transcription factor [Cytobacillus]MBS4190019.1 response regulator transcription factor [Cytobacillus citreus]QED50234.1 response regulator transcription factor [Cytobacillus dafuensis]